MQDYQINNGQTLPRSGNDPGENGIYHYQVDEIKLSGKKDQLIINPNADEQVYLCVSGNVTVGGNAKIYFQGSNNVAIDDFSIYGTGSNQEFTINGSPGVISRFIYAPTAKVSINGNGQWNGILWADTWDGSSAQNATLNVPDIPEDVRNEFKKNLRLGYNIGQVLLPLKGIQLNKDS